MTDKEPDGQIVSESKKDPSQRRHELLIKSDLAEVMLISI
jgi:pumilio family protein 6